MLRALKVQKLIRSPAPFTSPKPSDICPKLSGLRFRQAVQGTDINQPESESLDKMAQAPNEEMAVGTDSLTSLGEAYAARCEEEGFGGVILVTDKMAQPPSEETAVGTDSLTSLGEAYASRCEEEGFGGVIYGKYMTASKDEEDNNRSEAKEEEEGKDRNQGREATA
ncbi:uncharacterized protein [Coffea arabica]|uniref:Uncharacterized protein isoform X2 n=1 Tax=Coffea arabica TaxID=13443 RepID=A0A6P6T7H7_COFAR|nr:uncharacterized protein LOC113698601 isoform X2 [Coffea arabica]